MTITFTDFRPSESVTTARDLVQQGQEDAWEALDRHLRWHCVNHIQNRTEDLEDLEGALIEAAHWAIREEREPWRTRWPYLLELLTDADWQPSLAVGLRALEGRAAEMLSLLARSSQPLRPTDVSELLGISPQQVSNLGQKLESAGLIIRRKTGGRFTWLFPTVEGRELAGLIPGVKDSQATAPSALDEPVDQEEDGAAALWDEASLAQEVQEAA